MLLVKRKNKDGYKRIVTAILGFTQPDIGSVLNIKDYAQVRCGQRIESRYTISLGISADQFGKYSNKYDIELFDAECGWR